VQSVNIVGFDLEKQILYLYEIHDKHEGFDNVGYYDLRTKQYNTLYDKPKGDLGDIFIANDCIVINNFGWMEYVGLVDISGSGKDIKLDLDPNYSGIDVVDEDTIIFSQSLDICMINIDNIKKIVSDDNNLNLAEVEGAEVLVSNDNAQKCGIANGWFYYMPDDETICRVRLDDSKWEFFM